MNKPEYVSPLTELLTELNTAAALLFQGVANLLAAVYHRLFK